MKIRFFVPGSPKPGGSKTGFYKEKLNRVLMVDASKNTDWKNAVRFSCQQAYSGPLLEGSLSLRITFMMSRPKSHYKKNRELKKDAPHYHISRPDLTKLVRSTEDALTGVLWRDDAQIASQYVVKIYAEKPGAGIEIEKINVP